MLEIYPNFEKYIEQNGFFENIILEYNAIIHFSKKIKEIYNDQKINFSYQKFTDKSIAKEEIEPQNFNERENLLIKYLRFINNYKKENLGINKNKS